MQHWNFNVERQFGSRSVLEVADVDVVNARRIQQPFEQDRFRVCILLHVAVIIEMVLRQVRHRGHAECTAFQPSLVERVRRRF